MNTNIIESHVRGLLNEIEPGLEIREGLEDTPNRVARMYKEIFSGYTSHPEEVLGRTFHEEDFNEMVAVTNIEFYSHCEHHMVPFYGKVHIAYVPEGVVVGLSKLARLVECYAKRLQLQERMTKQIADTIESVLRPAGCMVVVKAHHLCMGMRGVRKPNAETITSAQRGIFCNNNNGVKQEFLKLIGGM